MAVLQTMIVPTILHAKIENASTLVQLTMYVHQMLFAQSQGIELFVHVQMVT